MDIKDDIKKIKTLLPHTMLRDRVSISFKLSKLQKPTKKSGGPGQNSGKAISNLLSRTEKSVKEKQKREIASVSRQNGKHSGTVMRRVKNVNKPKIKPNPMVIIWSPVFNVQ